jgi:hypothetical protein
LIMDAPQLLVSPEDFNISREASDEEGDVVVGEDLLTQEPAHLESALPPELARRVVEEAILLAEMMRPVRGRLTVEREGAIASLDLSLHVDPGAMPGLHIETPAGAEGVEFVLDARPDGRGTLRFDVHYAGLPLEQALSYARFLRALYWEKGTLSLTRLEPTEVTFELIKLPLPLDPAAKERTEDMVHLLEALDEVERATATEFVYPSEVDDEDLRNLNHALKAIRSGWIALPVTDFTTPMGPEGVRNILRVVAEEGEVLKALAMTAEWERVRVFDAWVDLGPSVRYISGARLATQRSEMEDWLASNPESDTSFNIRWVPVDDAWVHVFYNDWPKPSRKAIREDIRAFEEEYGRSSDEFRRAWEGGEQWARELEGGDVWITLLDAEGHIRPGV